MVSRNSSKIASGVLALVLVVVAPGWTRADTILTFDNLPASTNPDTGAPIPNGYGGLNWSNFSYVSSAAVAGKYGTSGFNNGMISSPNVAFNFNTNSPATISVSSGSFNLTSGYITGAWRNNLNVDVKGFINGNLVYEVTPTVNATAATLVNFSFIGVQSVVFTSSGGSTVYNGTTPTFVLDNLSFSMNLGAAAVPEPSPLVLGALGVVLAASIAVRRIR